MAAGGGTGRANVGYTLLKKWGWTASREMGTLGMSSGDTFCWPEAGTAISAPAMGPAALAANSAGLAGFAGLNGGLAAAGNWLICGVICWMPKPGAPAATEGSLMKPAPGAPG